MERNRPRIKPRIYEWLMAKVNELRELQSTGGDELSALSSSPSGASGIPSVLRPAGGAYKGEL